MFEKNVTTIGILLIAGASTLFTGCGSVGNMSAVKDGAQYAIDCKPDEALRELDKAEADGGLSGYMAQLERIVVLRDAGRTAAAESAMDAYMALPEVEDQTRADID
jgi:hypothetical protein